jgi:hypothetical protein
MVALLVIAFVFVWFIPGACAEERMRVVLDIRNSVVTTPSVLAGAIREASAIWAPYGVSVERPTRTGGETGAGGTTVVPVTLESARAGGRLAAHATPLGWTGFLRSEQPMMKISIFYDAIALAVSGGVLFGVRDVQSAILQQRLMARVMGRTIAHEVGHVVLRSAGHATSGLMRAAQSVAELQHPSGAGFALDPGDIARLRQVRGGASVAASMQDF